MFRVQSALTVQSGSILVNTYFLAFFNNDKLNGYGNNHTFSVALTYGLKDNFEIVGRVVPYQDDQVRDWGPPGETTLGLKWCTPVGGKYVRTGLLSFFRLPTAKSHNIPYEAYTSGKVAIGISGLITFDVPSDLPLQLNINLGYLDNNIGTFFKNEGIDQLILGLGFKMPLGVFIFYSEFTGEIFLNNGKTSFIDNSMRITSGLKFKMPLNLVFAFGADIGLSRKLDNYPVPLHEYASWKIFGGFTFHIFPRFPYLNAAKGASFHRDTKKENSNDIKNRRENVDQQLRELLKDLETKKDHNKKNEEN